MIILLSGEIAAGKTALAIALEEQSGYEKIRSGTYLAEIAKTRGLQGDRFSLQEMGDKLDDETQGSWIAELTRNQVTNNCGAKHWILDSVRRDFQVMRFREIFGVEIIHAHLKAGDHVLESRFRERVPSDNRDCRADYIKVKDSSTERHAQNLETIADITINSELFTPEQIARLINMAVNFRSKEATI